MTLLLLAAPAAEPLSLADAKHFLRVEHDDDDALIGALIVGARGHVEARTRRLLITQTWRCVLDAWPPDGYVALLIAPLSEVSAARVYDADGVAHALDVEHFVVNRVASPGLIAFAPWAVASPGRAFAGIELDVIAGYGAAASDVPLPLIQAIRLLVAHWYENRALVGAGAHAPLPGTLDPLLAPYRVMSL